MKDPTRHPPSVEKIMHALGPTGIPRPLVVNLVREAIVGWRQSGEIPSLEQAVEELRGRVRKRAAQSLQPVINGTGIIIHTNLGRSPLGKRAIDRVASVAGGYNNLEYDVLRGERGSRAELLEASLAACCEAPAATVVNNCAAALLLILRLFTSQRSEVILSRGELVQIGGGFRIPEILEASGARLREIGTTNKTSLADYERAIGERTGLILKVHRSNFTMAGFVESPATPEISALARAKGIPFVEDLGSGALIATEKVTGLRHEPTPAEVLRQGVDLVCFSGDKLMGGPQAGIIAGRADWVKKLKAEPFFRAVRCDKLVLAALEATVEAYLSGSETSDIPILAMLDQTVATLHTRAEGVMNQLTGTNARLRICDRPAEMGGGTLPETKIASVTLALVPERLKLEDFASKLREETPPLIGYVSDGAFHLDLRTIFPEQEPEVVRILQKVLGAS